jgi:hypothetical protein
MRAKYIIIRGDVWQWAEDYVYATATYVVACPPNRRCQVGMGLFFLGKPRGEKITFSGERDIVVIGIGALYFRVDDGLGPCKAGFMLKSNRPIGWRWDF